MSYHLYYNKPDYFINNREGESQIEKNKISIIVPVYNTEKYLNQCIDSILMQTYRNIELIMVDDGSTDNSLNIMKDYAKQDSRVKILSRENKGQFQTRNDGVKLSTGEYILFVDSDDWIDANMVEEMLRIQKEYNADIVRCNYIDEHVEENRKVPNPPIYAENTFIKKSEFREMVYPVFISTHQINSACGQMIRRDVIGEYQDNPEIRIAEDLMFNLQLYQEIKNVIFIPNTYYHYRANHESITNIRNLDALKRRIKNLVFVYSQYYTLIKEWNMDNETNQKLVTGRIFREIRRCIDITYTFRTSFLQKVEICQYGRKLLMNIQEIQEDATYLGVVDKWIIQGKHKRLVIYKFFQYKLLYSLKKIAKQILVALNQKKQINIL